MNSNPRLEFLLDLPKKENQLLQNGCLLIKHRPDAAGIKLCATSGCRGSQYHGSWSLKGRGPLPPSSAIAPKVYSVSTQRLWLPDVVGVEGSFYPISPFSVAIAGGLQRGDFGIHFDSNVPGSKGCCVLTVQAHWDIFRETMAEWRAVGVQQVPLSVVYS